jgi:dihydrofolate synthase/folylpolyglutamate synthase
VSDPAGAHFTALFGPEFGHGKPIETARIRALLDALGAPQRALPGVVHVAGTNGKGSTIAFLRAIFEAAGLSVGVFTKPHLRRLNERFRVRGALADDATLMALADEVATAGADATQFEAHVAAALLLFARARLDAVLIETGFGGRDDATSVIPAPRVCVLAPIDLDHQAILGETRAAIAAHKAGIIKPGARIVSARQQGDALPAIEAAAAAAGAAIDLCGRDWDGYLQRGRLIVQDGAALTDLPAPSLAGPHQADNAGLAVRAALAFADARVTEAALAAGVAGARWPGRLTPVARGAIGARVHGAGGELWVDGAHNPHAAAALARALQGLPKRARTIALVAMLARKDGERFLAALAPAIDALVALPLAEPDAVAPDALVALARRLGLAAEGAGSAEHAIALALANGPARLIACGSLRVVPLFVEEIG